MKASILFSVFIALFLFSCVRQSVAVLETGSQKPMPYEWIDKDTGHKIIRITRREGDNRSFYFHNNPFIPELNGEGDKMIFYGSDEMRPSDKLYRGWAQSQLYTVNLKTLDIEQLTNSPSVFKGEIAGKKSRNVFYQSNDSVFATQVDTHETRLIIVLPDSIKGQITALNADETLLAMVTGSKEKEEMYRQFPRKGDYFIRIYKAKFLHALVTIDVESGVMKKVHQDHAWLNHVQFSPTDPNILMFCHEGPWHFVDRIWTIDLNTGLVRLMHKRTADMEIAGHEFFSIDGQTIWFDLQIPKGQNFFLAGADLKSGKEIRYRVKRDEWSIHFNISPDQKIFAGDGGDSGQVAKAKDGMWLYLFHPVGDSLISEKLVNMKHHNYDLEPNVHFSPDGNWIIFRANFEGSSQSYAVQILNPALSVR